MVTPALAISNSTKMLVFNPSTMRFDLYVCDYTKTTLCPTDGDMSDPGIRLECSQWFAFIGCQSEMVMVLSFATGDVATDDTRIPFAPTILPH